jgi:hypothetical protein
MSVQLNQAVQEILNMPYYKNGHAKSGTVVHGHEDAVANILPNFGFTQVYKENYKKVSKKLLSNWAKTGDDTSLQKNAVEMPLGSYILQPAGTQGFPDILVKDFNGRFVAIECKSVNKGGNPMWNDSLPRPHAIYVLNSGKYNGTTLFLGKDVISQEELDLMQEQIKEMEKVVEKFNLLGAKIDKFNRGWCQKSRRQHFQFGGKEKVNYFTHVDRAKCEHNVLQYALE